MPSVFDGFPVFLIFLHSNHFTFFFLHFPIELLFEEPPRPLESGDDLLGRGGGTMGIPSFFFIFPRKTWGNFWICGSFFHFSFEETREILCMLFDPWMMHGFSNIQAMLG